MGKEKRLNVRISEAEKDKVAHYAERLEMSQSDFVMHCINFRIRYLNQDYDLPTAEIRRLNQLTDNTQQLVESIRNLHEVNITGFNMMLGFMRGENDLAGDGDLNHDFFK